MAFWQNVLSTAIGATLGFVFSIALFYISQRVRENTWRRDVRKSFYRELEFNRDYVVAQLDALEKTIERVSNDEREVFPVVRFSGLRTVAYGQYVASGYIWDDLKPKDVSELDEMLWDLGPGAEQLVFETVDGWKRGDSDKTTTYNHLDWKRTQLRRHVELLDRVRDTVRPLLPKGGRDAAGPQH